MRACLFDIDGTLVMTGGAGQQAFAQTFREEFDIKQIATDVAFAGRSDRAIAMDFFQAHGIEPSDASWERFCAGYLPRLEASLERCVGRVLPGAVELVDRLEQRGDIHLGLLTGNVQAGAQRKLTYYGLWDRFATDAGVLGGFGDHHLDRNDIARAAVDQSRARHGANGAADETVVIIGDTPNDIRCARAVNAKAVAVPTGHHSAEELAEHDPDLLITTLEDADALCAWFDA